MTYRPNAESEYHVLKILIPLEGYEDVITYGIYLATSRGLLHIANAENFAEAKRLIQTHMDRRVLDD
jgi:hypothetical protein